MLDHERLDVYQSSIAFVALAYRLIELLPRSHAALADQLRRAATSIPLNIAEGAGKGPGERTQHHRIARGSAMECGAILDVVRLLNITAQEELDKGKEILVRVVSMLSRMSR